MKLDNWVGIAEITSAIAVVISLIYVGVELNQNTDEVRAANRQELINRAHLATLTYSSNPSFANLLAKIQSEEPISQSDRIQYGYAVRAVLYDSQEAYLLFLEGRLDSGYWNTRKQLVALYLGTPLAREIYQQDRDQGLLHTRFTKMLDSSEMFRMGVDDGT